MAQPVKRKFIFTFASSPRKQSNNITSEKTSINVLPVLLSDGSIIYVNHWVLSNVSPIIRKHVEQFANLSDIQPVNYGGCMVEWEFIMHLARVADIAMIRFERERLNWVSLFTIMSRIEFNRNTKLELFIAIMNYGSYCNITWTALPYEYNKIVLDYVINLIKRQGPITVTFNLLGVAKKENLMKMINDLGLQRDLFNAMIELSGPPANFSLV